MLNCLCVQIDDYSMVRFLPFDRTDEEGINIVLQHIDFSIQYGEDLEFKEPKVKKQTKAKHDQIAFNNMLNIIIFVYLLFPSFPTGG